MGLCTNEGDRFLAVRTSKSIAELTGSKQDRSRIGDEPHTANAPTRLSSKQREALRLLCIAYRQNDDPDDGWGIYCAQATHRKPNGDVWVNERTADALEARGLVEIHREVGLIITLRPTQAGRVRARPA